MKKKDISKAVNELAPVKSDSCHCGRLGTMSHNNREWLCAPHFFDWDEKQTEQYWDSKRVQAV